MKTILTRLFTVIMLMMINMVAKADVKVLYGENGSETFEGKGGSIKIEQADSKGDKAKVTVYLTFIPDTDKGFVFDESTLEVYAVVSTGSASTRAPEISGDPLKLTEEKTDVPSAKCYSVKIDPNLALWVKNANFQEKEDGSKGNRETASVAPQGNDYSGKYCIANMNGYKSSTPESNYYLVPATNSNYNSITNQPHLTTTQSGKVSTSYWTIEKSGDYYHIIYADGRYLTANTYYAGTSGNDRKRLRVHLEEKSEPDNNTLFIILPNVNGGFNIKHKDITDNIYLDPAGGNINGTNITNARQMTTSSGKVNVGGGIGYWDDEPAARWVFEDIVETPTVSINSEGKAVISSSDENATYYYTADGTTKPTTGSGSTQYTSPIDITSIETVKAIAVVNGEVSNVATYTVGNGTPYIIQNQECTAYYLISGDETQTNVPANTSSIYGPKIEWLLKYAGNINGIQYYYFVNNATKDYLYRTGNNVYVKAFAANDDGYKFNFFTQNTDGSYNIYAKGVTGNGLYKVNGNVASNSVQSNGTLTNTNAKWKFIATSGISDKRSLFEDSPVEESKYYKIASLGADGSYIISPKESGDTEYAGASTTETNDNMVWRFEVAGHDEWQTYYNIVHVTTGKYMYYTGPTTTATQANAIEMKESLTDNDRFRFVLARATTTGCYYIIPKTHKDVFKDNQYYGIWYDNQNTDILKTIKSRSSSANNVKWKFEETTTFVAPPSITFSADDMKVTMQSTTQDITGIQYDVTKDSEAAPTSASTDYPNGGISVKYGPIYHFAARTKKGGNTSILVTKDIDLSYIADPTISVSGNTVTFSTSQKGITFYYTTDGSDPIYTDKNASDNHGTAIESNSEGTASVTLGNEFYYIKVIAVSILDDSNNTGYSSSSDMRIVDLREATTINTLADIKSQTGYFKCSSTFSATGTPRIDGTGDEIGTSSKPFKGTLKGYWDETKKEFKSISLSKPLFDYVEDATIKNIIVAEGTISGSGNVGAIAGNALGDTRIYNCGVLGSITENVDANGNVTYSYGSSISGDQYVGSIVGFLDGSSRVINCYSYAEITEGTSVGGIVGYNNVATTSTNLQTMVMNCMFYGNIKGGNAAPIYGGENIHNKYASTDNTGLNNYCYFLYDEEKNPYVKTIANDKYHGALGAEERYLNRFEFFRMMLNSTRNLAAYYVTGYATQKEEMAKWVLDKSIAPYPILKVQDNYPSVVNPDATHATTQTERNKGGLLGTLSVTISGIGSGDQFSAPTGASIKTSSKTLNITDKDEDNFNFNYKKVQLPYYNEVGTGNYTGGCVVTGWKIVEINNSPTGTGDFVNSGTDAPAFNFVDRTCTNKDLYSESGRVFAQGAYWEVPDGVTSITIEPYWAKAVYLSDANYDMTYTITINGSGSNSTATANKYGVTVCGSCPTVFNGQTVYTDLSTAMTNLASNANNSVYDYAVVLVGNYHQAANDALVKDGKPVTFMSADLDGDNEPDNTLFYYHNQRRSVSPIRFDFLNIPGIGMVKRTHDATMDPEPGIFAPQGWFEITNTVFIRFGQFEYAGSNSFLKSKMSPLILQGGIYEQFVSCCRTNAKNTNYLLVGGNAWFKNFANGCHTAQPNTTPKVPVNVTGGDYTNFYLTGIYQPDTNEASANAECYIDGGRFKEVAGAGMQQINGNVTWLINAADITSFFGGGINAAKPITGSISTTISNSYVDEFYGGPKFGDMSEEKTVTTNATDCHFGKYFGAGYGGTAFNRVGYKDDSNANNSRTWDTWVTDYYKRKYSADDSGISTNYEYEFILHSDGNQTVARFFVNYASLSLASTRNVTNTLTGCTIGTFYGGGSLGAVNGDVNSTLKNCTVTGNAFGAGFSASVPTVEVWNTGAYLAPKPTYNRTANVFNNASVKTPKDNNQYIVYTWSKTHGSNTNPLIDTEDGKHYIHTDVSLDDLGSVSGNATLNINGTTTVGGNVYGGGEESGVGGSTQVFINNTGTAGTGNVFGAGKGLETDYEAALVKGNSTVTMSDGIVKGNIYGGGELSSVGTFRRADEAYHTAHPTVEVGTVLNYTAGGTTTVTISGGTVGNSSEYTYNAESRLSHTNGGNVFAGCKGVLKKSDDSYLSDWIKFARVKNTVLNVSGENTRIMSNIYGGGEIGSVGYLDESGALVEGCGASVTVSSGTIGTEIKDGDATQYTFGSVFGGGYGSDLETTIEGQEDNTDPNAPKLFAGRIYGNASVAMTDGAVKASVYGGGELASVSGNATVTVSGGSVGIPKVGNKQFGGATMGNVYGGGSGNKNIVRAGLIFGNTTVDISQAEGKTTHIYHNIYGGGAYGSVGTYTYTYTTDDPNYQGIAKVNGISSCATNTGGATITITGGTIGADGKENGMIFGSSRGDVGALGSRDDLVAWVNTTEVTIGAANTTGPTIKGSVYGSGENGHTFSDATVTVHSGIIGIHDGTPADGTRGNVYGSGCGTDKYYSGAIPEGHTATDGEGDSYNPKAGIVQGIATVTIDGGHVLHNVYGAGAMGPVGIDGVGHKTTVNINGGRIGYDGNDNGYVFGGARGAQGIERNFAYVGDTEVNINYATTPNADNNEKTVQLIAGSVFGGGEAGSVHGTVVVNMNKGLVLNDVYGGGALADTNTGNWGTTTWADDKTAASNTTTVNLKGGKINRNVYGGGLGQTANVESNLVDVEAKVYGNVLVELNNGVANDAKGCVVLGSIFGCNNLNGTPMGDVKVHIYKTQNDAATCIANAPASGETPAVEDAKMPNRYDVAAVYGGGNQSAYVPADLENNKTEVIIDGCDLTSIQQVYGGGNAACTPATNVTVNGTFEINELFGGGNGYDNILINGVEMPNPGANVGYKNYSEYYKEPGSDIWQVRDKSDADTKEKRMGSSYVYGTGKASVNIYGGTVHHVFGGSNTKGNVRKTAVTLLEELEGDDCCPFKVDEAYGGGKSAEMDAEAQLLMACIPGLEAVYGGAEAADVRGNVTLNITNGTFDRVFGGNNLSGTIGGSITINVEEIGCRPVKIGELYGGGNKAGYSVYGYDSAGKPKESGTRLYDDPQVNVMSFTSIGNIYGGGFGDGATLVGNPTVNVNVVYGKYYDNDLSVVGENAKTPNNYPIPSHAKGKMGAISNVFGGGNAAKVIGNTNVNIATLEEVYVVKQVTGTTLPAGCYTRNNDGTYSAATGTVVDGTTYYEKKNVLGVDIRGNVYGGGNNAEVTGDSKVKIGKKVEGE